MEENRLAIEKGIKAEMVEDFMTGLKNLFTEHYVDLPEEKVSIVEELASKVASLEEDLDSVIASRSELAKELNEHKKSKIAAEISEGLSEVQCAKLMSLAENIEFVSEEDYKEKLALTKQKYFDVKQEEVVESKQNSMIDTDGETLEESFSPVMSRYVQSISRIVKK
jgi:predicted transcriptional regulator